MRIPPLARTAFVSKPDYNTAADNGAPVADPKVEATQERLAQLGY
jgi:hypothetical protein